MVAEHPVEGSLDRLFWTVLIGLASVAPVAVSVLWAGRARRRARERSERALVAWTRLLRKAKKVRKQQRYFAFLGHALQEHGISRKFRDRIAKWL